MQIAGMISVACLVAGLSACSKAKVDISSQRGAATTVSFTNASPIVAKSGEVVTLRGSGLNSGTSYKAVFSPTVSVDVTVFDDSTATFIMPSGLGSGEKSFTISDGAQARGSVTIIAADNGTLEIYSNDASLVCSGDSFFNKQGEVIQGTRDCSGGTDINPWDVRAGVTIGSVTGKLQVNCRNGANLSLYDQGTPQKVVIDPDSDSLDTMSPHGFQDNQSVRISYNNVPPGGLSYNTIYYVRYVTDYIFKLSTSADGDPIDITSGGTGPVVVYAYQLNSGSIDRWDTIDDLSGFANSIPDDNGWLATNLCGGIEAVFGDSGVWRDVTTAGSGDATCSGSPENCFFKDKISGLEWLKPGSATYNWSAAQEYCDNLTYNEHSDWRLPTQKELTSANTNGIASTADAAGWMTFSDIDTYYWSASSNSNNSANAWAVKIATGDAGSATRTANYRALCVRP